MTKKPKPFTIGFIHTFFCNSCKQDTNHELVYVHKHIDWGSKKDIIKRDSIKRGNKLVTVYRLWMCKGCETHKLEIGLNKSTMPDGTFECQFYPDFIEYQYEPLQYQFVDKIVGQYYYESVSALNNGLYLSSAMMLRGLIESLCFLNGIKDKEAWGLGKKIGILTKKLKIEDSISFALSKMKYLGDMAAHKLVAPSYDELKLGIQLSECLLDHLYESNKKLKSKATEFLKLNKRKGKHKNQEREDNTYYMCDQMEMDSDSKIGKKS